jgi:C1A family cysteine protease
MSNIHIYLLRGQGGVATSGGVDQMANTLRSRYPSASVSVWDWGQWQQAYSDMRNNAADASSRNILIGYSLGANGVDWISVQTPRPKIDLGVFLDPTVWSQLFPIHDNVQRALVFKNDNPVNVVGLANVPTVPDFDMRRLTVIHTWLPHLEEDWDPSIQQTILAAVDKAIQAMATQPASFAPGAAAGATLVIDTNDNVTAHIAHLKARGVKAVGRYYSSSAWKRLTQSEARQVSAAGIKLFTVFENDGDPVLSSDAGISHGQIALQQAHQIGQPEGSAIYFALEHLPSGYRAVHVPGIKTYVSGLRVALQGKYKLGVYSDGVVCDALLAAGLCDYTWLSASSSFEGSKAFYQSGRWNLAQKASVDQNWDGLSVDLNEAKPTFGEFTVTAAPGMAAPRTRAVPRFGWKPELPDHRDYSYSQRRLGFERPVALPAQVDLRQYCPPIMDQGELNSCTANALGAAFAFDRKKQGAHDFSPSRLFIYYNERKIEGDIPEDGGAYLRDGIKTLVDSGVCPESSWPYDATEFAAEPLSRCYQLAQDYKALSYYSLDNAKLDELRTCLAAGFPFVFGFSIYNSFFQADQNAGIVPMPGDEQPIGGHAVLAVGYNDATRMFTIQNSWGTQNRGDHGFYYMPYDYVTSDSCDDFWTIRLVTAAAAQAGNAGELPTAEITPLAPAATPLVGFARDMQEAKKYLSAIIEAAHQYNLAPSLICALGSRESDWGLSPDMRPKGPAGTGDWAPRNPARYGYGVPPDGLGWGRGLLQIDYQQEFAKSGNWRDPHDNIMYGCQELSANIQYFRQEAQPGIDPIRAGVAAYNCGRGNVVKAIAQGYDIDHYTANNDYSHDVLNRTEWFRQRGFDQLIVQRAAQ